MLVLRPPIYCVGVVSVFLKSSSITEIELEKPDFISQELAARTSSPWAGTGTPASPLWRRVQFAGIQRVKVS